MRQLAVLVLSAGVASSAWAQDEPPLPDNVKGLKVVIPEAKGQNSWGRAQLVKSLRRTMTDAIGPLILSRDLEQAQKKLKLKGSKAIEPDGLAKAAREVGAQYILQVTITKKGWLFTARAMLVNAADAEVLMDFRSQYFKPAEEAPDRGKRIGRRTVERLSQLVTDGGAVAVAPPPDSTEPPFKDDEKDDLKDEKDDLKDVKDEKDDLKVDDPPPDPPPPPPIVVTQADPPPPQREPPPSQKVEVEAQPAEPEEEIIRAMLGGGSGLLRTYTLSSDAVESSGLSYPLKPVSLVTAEIEVTVPGVGLAFVLGGAFRPVRYQLDFVDASPRGALIDSYLSVAYNIAVAGSGLSAFEIAPRVSGRFGIYPVQENPGNSILSARAISVTGGIGARLPVNETLEINLGVDGGVIVSYSESPATTGQSGFGWTVGGDLSARIWLTPIIAIAFDNRFTFENIGFDGTPTRQLPEGEEAQIQNAKISIKDLRTSIGVAFRF